MGSTSMSSKDGGTTLLIIDPQIDFHPGGSLPVANADKDAERIATLIRSSIEKNNVDTNKKIDRIFVTLDTHHKLHIGHPCFWIDVDGNHPNPFTLISPNDVESGVWSPRKDIYIPDGTVDKEVFSGGFQDDGSFDLKKFCVEYMKNLEKSGRFKHCVWPEHCLLGSSGHNVFEVITAALNDWIESTGNSIVWVLKGENLLTENYSALCPEVPISKSTKFNDSLYKSLQESNKLLICGQALSHCVNHTARNIVDRWPQAERNKISILTNCTSSVPGFEQAGDNFLKDMKESGVTLCSDSGAFD